MSGLLPSQQRWTAMRFADWQHFNLGALSTVPAEMSTPTLLRAVQRLLDRSPALRTAYRPGADGWQAQERTIPADAVVRVPRQESYRGRADDLVAEIVDLQQTLDPESGAVLRVVHFPCGAEPGRLLVLVHHLTLDGFSMGLLAGELDRALADRPAGPTPVAPAVYLAAVEKWVESDEARYDSECWLARPWDRVDVPPTELRGAGQLPSMRLQSAALDRATTAQLTSRCRTSQLRPSDILLDAAAQAIMDRWGLAALAVDAYHLGRHVTPLGVDVVDTIGYLQNTFPIVFSRRDRFEPGDLLAVPQRLFGFDALRHVGDRLTDVPASVVRFNFRGHLGRLDRRPGEVLATADEPIRRLRSPRQTEAYRLMLEGDVIDGELYVHVKYSTDHYLPDTVDALLADTVQRVRRTVGELP